MPFATKDTGLNYDPQADQIQAGATRIPQIGRNGDSLRFQPEEMWTRHAVSQTVTYKIYLQIVLPSRG